MKIECRKACLKGALALALACTFSMSWAEVDMQRISKDALVKAPETVDCTLENGAASRCVKLVVCYKSSKCRFSAPTAAFNAIL